VIYFMRLANRAIKIGHSANVDNRLKTLRDHFEGPVELLKVLEGGRQEEKEMHARFAHLRFPNTEQFLPTSELLEFIEADPTSDPLPSSPNPKQEHAERRIKVSISVSSELWEEAEKRAKEEGRSTSRVIERAVQLAFDASPRAKRRAATPST
jgi:Meiotically up-regulated gene 113/Ribbon-helix-helix protein, copG family